MQGRSVEITWMAAPAAITELPTGTGRIIRELDHARQSGARREIVIPPSPEQLQQLRQALARAEPDLPAVSRIAARDVAMAATLVRNANGARFAAGQPVATVGQAMNRRGHAGTGAVRAWLRRYVGRSRSPHRPRHGRHRKCQPPHRPLRGRRHGGSCLTAAPAGAGSRSAKTTSRTCGWNWASRRQSTETQVVHAHRSLLRPMR